MQEGTIKVLTEKGYGFITVPGHEKEVFFHASSVFGRARFNELKKGDEVIISEIEVDEKGEHAKRVELK